jgi:AcrR family transcriptional regulator
MEFPNRQDRKRELTNQSLKNAFIQLVLKYGSEEPITISDITDLADLNRSTFYIHFQDKYDLLDSLYEDAVNGLYYAYKIPYKDMEKLEMVEAVPFTTLLLEHIEKNKKLFKALTLIEANPDIHERIEEMIFKLFTEEIILVVENPGEIDYEIFLNYHLHATLGVIKYWIKKDFIHPVEFISEQLTSFPLQRVVAMKLKED